jgi:hypothetical protein
LFWKTRAMKFCLPLLVCTVLLLGCQPANTAATAVPEYASGTCTNIEYGYALQIPEGAHVEITSKGGHQIKVHAGIDDPFQIKATRDYFPSDVTFYLDTRSGHERKIGGNRWSEFVLPKGYCDATVCSMPMYVLQMEVADVLYTVTFYSQDTTTASQEQILSTFQASGKRSSAP